MRKLTVVLVLLLSTVLASPVMADCVVCGRFPDGKSECIDVDSFGAASCRNLARGGGCIAIGVGDCGGTDGPPECYNRPDYPGCDQYNVFNLEFRIELIEIEAAPMVATVANSTPAPLL